MTDEQRHFIASAMAEAVRANHPFALMAACEAALESGWGKSYLAIEACNLFGCKQHLHPVYGTMTLPTREFSKERGWVVIMAGFVKYPDWRACFADRLVTLERLAPNYPHYAAALAATDAETYIAEVSKAWSTDPERAQKCTSIYRQYLALNAPSNPVQET